MSKLKTHNPIYYILHGTAMGTCQVENKSDFCNRLVLIRQGFLAQTSPKFVLLILWCNKMLFCLFRNQNKDTWHKVKLSTVDICILFLSFFFFLIHFHTTGKHAAIFKGTIYGIEPVVWTVFQFIRPVNVKMLGFLQPLCVSINILRPSDAYMHQ